MSRSGDGEQHAPRLASADHPNAEVTDQYGRKAAAQVRSAAWIFGIAWLIMWGPVYLRLPIATLYLWPILMLMVVPVTVLAILALVNGSTAARASKGWYPQSLGLTLVGAAMLLVLPLPALWFGNAPLQLFGVTP